MAVVTRLLPSTDSKLRALELRTEHGLITRPLYKVFPLLSRTALHGPEKPVADEDSDSRNEAKNQDQREGSSASTRPTRAAKELARRRVRQWTRPETEEETEDD